MPFARGMHQQALAQMSQPDNQHMGLAAFYFRCQRMLIDQNLCALVKDIEELQFQCSSFTQPGLLLT